VSSLVVLLSVLCGNLIVLWIFHLAYSLCLSYLLFDIFSCYHFYNLPLSKLSMNLHNSTTAVFLLCAGDFITPKANSLKSFLSSVFMKVHYLTNYIKVSEMLIYLSNKLDCANYFVMILSIWRIFQPLLSKTGEGKGVPLSKDNSTRQEKKLVLF